MSEPIHEDCIAEIESLERQLAEAQGKAEFCYWCSRAGRGDVPATEDGGRFGPLCAQCANAVAIEIAPLLARGG